MSLPLLSGARSADVEIIDAANADPAINAAADLFEREVLFSHLKAGCVSVWCKRDSRLYPFVFTRRVVWGTGSLLSTCLLPQYRGFWPLCATARTPSREARSPAGADRCQRPRRRSRRTVFPERAAQILQGATPPAPRRSRLYRSRPVRDLSATGRIRATDKQTRASLSAARRRENSDDTARPPHKSDHCCDKIVARAANESNALTSTRRYPL
jgi:hypothetical protein